MPTLVNKPRLTEEDDDMLNLPPGIEAYDANTEKALVASFASAAGVDASQVVIESASFPIEVRCHHSLSWALLTFF